jgi:3-hydroxyacyl-[acyl-carrier-protein] dehydratase
MTQEIRQCMSDMTETAEGGIRSRFVFPPEFVGFQGHFPDHPILPGVCKMQAVLLLLQEWYQKEIRLKEIVMAKFLSPVSCGEELIFECREVKKTGDEILVKAFVTSNKKKVSEFKLRVAG